MCGFAHKKGHGAKNLTKAVLLLPNLDFVHHAKQFFQQIAPRQKEFRLFFVEHLDQKSVLIAVISL